MGSSQTAVNGLVEVVYTLKYSKQKKMLNSYTWFHKIHHPKVITLVKTLIMIWNCAVLHEHSSNKLCVKMGIFSALNEYEYVIYLNDFAL